MLRFAPAFFWAIGIAWLSEGSAGAGPSWPGADKVVHAGLFGMLMFWLLWGTRFAQGASALICSLLTVGYGVLDEVHQSFVPGRFPDAWDAVADAVGVGLVWVGALLVRRWRQSRLR